MNSCELVNTVQVTIQWLRCSGDQKIILKIGLAWNSGPLDFIYLFVEKVHMKETKQMTLQLDRKVHDSNTLPTQLLCHRMNTCKKFSNQLVQRSTLFTLPFNGPFPRLARWAGTRKVKPIWILLEQETVNGSGISLAICKSASRSRQITMPVPHHSFFTGRMPFLPPNQQRQSTEGNTVELSDIQFRTF